MTDNSETVIVKGSFQLSDYWRANRYLQNRMPRVWFVRIFLILMPWLIIMVQYNKDPNGFTWWTLLVPLFLIVMLFLILPLIDRSSLKRRMKNVPAAFSQQSYGFSDNGIEIVGENKDVKLKWPAIIKATESSSDFFLFVGSNMAQFVPKRFLSDVDQEGRLREILRRNLAEKAKL